ncbi:MAG: hypothetical protein CMQ54_03525 [Gammaproteobacteria bacterium]|mgnify:CR=1 FL=1|nr:hypothetical protein [Gammaproteobacteria bacterium]
MIKKLFLITIFAPSCCNFFAQESINDVGIELIDEFLNKVITFDSKFDQSLIDINGFTAEAVTGTLEIERSKNKFRWSYSEPYKQWLIADGLNIWNYDVDLGQVIVKPQKDALAGTPAILLSGSESIFEKFKLNSVSILEKTTWVQLVPRDNLKFKWVKLGFIDRQLSKMTFLDNLDQKTLINFYDVKQNQSIDPTRFEFIAFDDVDLIGIPATNNSKNK